MKLAVPLFVLLAGVLISGCTSHKSKSAKPAAPAPAASVIITPDTSLAAKVVSYDSVGRFVVLSFPIGPIPAAGQTFFLYRNGLKVAEIRTGDRQLNNLIIADLVSGDAQPGDEARDR